MVWVRHVSCLFPRDKGFFLFIPAAMGLHLCSEGEWVCCPFHKNVKFLFLLGRLCAGLCAFPAVATAVLATPVPLRVVFSSLSLYFQSFL